MRYFPPRHNLTSRITASLLIILYILTLGPLKEVLAFVIPQNLLPAPDYNIRGQAPAGIHKSIEIKAFWIPALAGMTKNSISQQSQYTKFTTLEPAKGYQVNLSSECILRITGVPAKRGQNYFSYEKINFTPLMLVDQRR